MQILLSSEFWWCGVFMRGWSYHSFSVSHKIKNRVAGDPSNSKTIIVLTSQQRPAPFLSAGSVAMPLPACFDLVLRSSQFILCMSVTLIDCKEPVRAASRTALRLKLELNLIIVEKNRSAQSKGKCGQTQKIHILLTQTITRKLLYLGCSSIRTTVMVSVHLTCRHFLIKGGAKSNIPGFCLLVDWFVYWFQVFLSFCLQRQSDVEQKAVQKMKNLTDPNEGDDVIFKLLWSILQDR